MLEGRAKPPDRPKAARAGLPRIVPVEVAAARTDSVVDALRATGQIEAVSSIELRPEVDGRLVEHPGARRVARHHRAGALQGGRRGTEGPGCAGRGGAGPGGAGAEPHPTAAGREGRRRRRPGAGRGAGPEHGGLARPAAAPAGSDRGPGALLRRGGRPDGECRRLRLVGDTPDHAADGESPARQLPGAGAVRRPARRRPGGALPGGGPARARTSRAAWISSTRRSSSLAAPSR